jgi:hypothetical protein
VRLGTITAAWSFREARQRPSAGSHVRLGSIERVRIDAATLGAVPDALAEAAESIDSGAAARTLDAWVNADGSAPRPSVESRTR